MKPTISGNCRLLLVAACLVASPAIADSFRCSNDVMRAGMEAKEIREKCGPATLTRIVKAPVMTQLRNGTSRRTGTSITLLWYYERGPDQYVARVTIRGSTVDQIDILDVKSIESLREGQ